MNSAMAFLFCLAPGTILLAAGAYLLTTGHDVAGGSCVAFGIASFSAISFNHKPREGKS